MKSRRAWHRNVVVMLALVMSAGCAAPPSAGRSDTQSPAAAPAPPPAPPPKPDPVPQPVPAPPPQVVIIQQPPPAAAPAPMNEEEQQVLALIADLQRYAAETGDEHKRELVNVTQALNRTKADVSRIRLAMLLTLPAAGPTDDARALALLDTVIGKTPAGSPIKQLAAVLYAQIAERARGIREEQRKTAAAQEKLDALRAVERSLLLERNRNAGGAGGGGGGGGTGR